MPRMKGADVITEFLVDSKISLRVRGFAGTAMSACWIRCTPRATAIKMVSPRHEQVAGHMADAYFRVKHEVW